MIYLGHAIPACFVMSEGKLTHVLSFSDFERRRHVLRRPAVQGGVRQVQPRRLQEVQGEDRQGRAAPGRHGAVAHVRRQAGTQFNRRHFCLRNGLRFIFDYVHMLLYLCGFLPFLNFLNTKLKQMINPKFKLNVVH